MRAEVTNLIKRIPRRHLHREFACDVRNRHRNVEQMLFGMFEGDAVLNSGLAGCAEQEQTQKKEKERAHQPSGGRKKTHRASASLGTTELSFLRSFSHKPSKLPLDMISSRSPDLASLARCSAMASELGKACASFPSFLTSAATASGSMRFSSPNCCAR